MKITCRAYLLFVLAPPIALIAIALGVSGVDLGYALSNYHRATFDFSSLFAMQLFFAMGVVFVIALVVSSAGFLLRWLLYLTGFSPDERSAFSLTAEGLIVGLVVVGTALGWAPKDVYTCGQSELLRIEIRSPSLLEGPLGFHHCSDCFVPVTVTYRDAISNLTVVQSGTDYSYGTRAQRASDRIVSWGTNTLQRVVVQLPASCDCLFFPEPVPDALECPSESVIDAYLRGEPVDVVQRMYLKELPGLR